MGVMEKGEAAESTREKLSPFVLKADKHRMRCLGIQLVNNVVIAQY